jgi:hypothetical protein
VKSILLGHGATGRPIDLSEAERETHMHVIGSSGSGKSKFLEQMMRGDLANRQGFCLIDPHGNLYSDVLNYCAHKVLRRDIVLLNLSSPAQIIGFNPFKGVPDADVSVQVGRRIRAVTHAWGVENTDQTPTLERTLRLIFTILLETGLPFHQARHLINFQAGEFRSQLVDKLSSDLIRQEWEELSQLRAKDWRAEMLSAKNRLFRLLTSETLSRFFAASVGIDLAEIIESGKVLLVNLAPSEYLSDENARVFGSLLLNELFEAARRRRAAPGSALKPYYLYLDEFQNFVSLDVASMLDQVRKYKLFCVLAHQRFGQLDMDMMDAVLTNCRIKAVFGGLPVSMAEMMARELFIGELDPKRIKVAVYQTKFWPEYRRDKVYSRQTSYGHSTGQGENFASSEQTSHAEGQFFAPQEWFGGAEPTGTSTSSVRGQSEARGRHSNWTDFEGTAESESDVPILIPVPFKELSSLQFYTPDEQLVELTAALKEQFGRHCFIKIHQQKTQPLRVPLVREFVTPESAAARYVKERLATAGAQPCIDVDRTIAEQDAALKRSPATNTQSKAAEPGKAPSWADLIGRE